MPRHGRTAIRCGSRPLRPFADVARALLFGSDMNVSDTIGSDVTVSEVVRSPSRPRTRWLVLVPVAGAVLGGCYASHEVAAAGDGGPRTDAPSVTDARSDRDAGRDAPVTCATCTCSWGGVDAGAPGCEALGLWECCAAVGPCAPPDLPA